MKNKIMEKRGAVFFRLRQVWGGMALWGLMVFGCSSAPERPAELAAFRDMAQTQLELANREADQKNYEAALNFVDEARRLATSIDNPVLLVRTGLSRGNILFYLGKTEDAAGAWKAALAEAEAAGEADLAALSRIHIARGRLLAAPSGTARIAEEVRSQVREELAAIKTDRLAAAFGWTVAGLAEKELRLWDDAELSLKKALEVHERGNYLSEAAYDWFLIASVRSVAGRYDAAVEALMTALKFDRRGENTYGLASDWRALGDVYKKMGDPVRSDAAYRRSEGILETLKR